MADIDTIRWIDATGQPHIPLNVPEFAPPQYAVVQQIRQLFDADAPFWQGQPLAGADLAAVDQLLRVILPTVPPTELTRRTTPEKIRFLVRWFAL